MRKIKAMLMVVAALFALLLVGCKSEPQTQKYVIDNDMEIMMSSELKEAEMPGHDYFMSDGTVMVFIDRTTDEEWAEFGITSATDVTDILEKLTMNTGEFVPNKAGNPYMTTTKEISGKDSFLYITGRHENGSLWSIEFMCPADKQSEYMDQFEQWNDSIVIK